MYRANLHNMNVRYGGMLPASNRGNQGECFDRAGRKYWIVVMEIGRLCGIFMRLWRLSGPAGSCTPALGNYAQEGIATGTRNGPVDRFQSG